MCADAVILTAIYAAYLVLLARCQPGRGRHRRSGTHSASDRTALRVSGELHLIGGLFAAGGALIYLSAEPFLGSLFAISIRLGIPAFVFVQWVAPFISEFPEGAFHFLLGADCDARADGADEPGVEQHQSVDAANGDVAGGVSISAGGVTSIPFDGQQKSKLLMTIGQHWWGMTVPGQHGAGVVGGSGAIRFVAGAVPLFRG